MDKKFTTIQKRADFDHNEKNTEFEALIQKVDKYYCLQKNLQRHDHVDAFAKTTKKGGSGQLETMYLARTSV